MRQRGPHTLHFASSFGGSKSLLPILCLTLPPPTGIVGLRGPKKKKKKGGRGWGALFWARILS